MPENSHPLSKISIGFSEYPSQDWAVTLYIPGCENMCSDCHNKSLFDYNEGAFFLFEDIIRITEEKLFSNHTNKIVLLGGDPLYRLNISFTDQFIYSMREYDICLYTGYELDYVLSVLDNVHYLRFLKCGTYDKSKSQNPSKTSNHLRLASTNQKMYKIIDGSPVLISENGVVPIGE